MDLPRLAISKAVVAVEVAEVAETAFLVFASKTDQFDRDSKAVGVAA